MATITNPNRGDVVLPSGHIVPGATGKWSEDGFVCTVPGVLTTTNDVLRGDDAVVLHGPVASGALTVVYDQDAEPVYAVVVDYMKAQKEDAERECLAKGPVYEVFVDYMKAQKNAAESELPTPHPEPAPIDLDELAPDLPLVEPSPVRGSAAVDPSPIEAAVENATIVDAPPVTEAPVEVPAPVVRRR